MVNEINTRTVLVLDIQTDSLVVLDISDIFILCVDDILKYWKYSLLIIGWCLNFLKKKDIQIRDLLHGVQLAVYIFIAGVCRIPGTSVSVWQGTVNGDYS